VYASLLTLQWLKGIAAVEKLNNAKAEYFIPKLIETLYLRDAAVEDRSTMNATFLLNDAAHAETFDAMWKAANISIFQDIVQ
jgi:phosphoserine aminotransferase